VATQTAATKRNQAKRAADALAAVNGITGVCVFGSVARGQAHQDSDIDMLILGTSPDLRVSRLREALPPQLRDCGIALTYFTADRLATHLSRATVFGEHLRKEGWIVYDRSGELTRLIQATRPLAPDREI
jgi:predicted nucleotidyltransferase